MRTYNGGDELWRDDAVCAQLDIETAMRLFYPPGNSDRYHTDIEASRQICSECPVMSECLEYALQIGEPYGTWGGATEWERVVLRKKYDKGEIDLAGASGHGTEAMATKCKLKNGKMCRACRAYYDKYLRPKHYKRCLGCDVRYHTTDPNQKYHDAECARANGRKIAAAAKREMANA